MEAIIKLVLITAVSWFYAFHCRKQRKFYVEHGYELFGTVVSWNKHTEGKGNYKKIYYDLEIMAENGETYNISTPNRKARKYKTENNITIIVPQQLNNNGFNPDLDEISTKERSETISEDVVGARNLLRKIYTTLSKRINSVHAVKNKQIIIKEDIKSLFMFWLFIVMGVLFFLTTIFLIVLLSYL